MMPRRFISFCLALVVTAQPLTCCCVVAEMGAVFRPKATVAKPRPAPEPACCCGHEKPSAPAPDETPPPRRKCACHQAPAATAGPIILAAADHAQSLDWVIVPADLPVAGVGTVEPTRTGTPFPFLHMRDYLNRCHLCC